jgi:hypothetical protein
MRPCTFLAFHLPVHRLQKLAQAAIVFGLSVPVRPKSLIIKQIQLPLFANCLAGVVIARKRLILLARGPSGLNGRRLSKQKISLIWWFSNLVR